MDPINIIEKHYEKGTLAFRLLIKHSLLVRKKALQVAKRIPDLDPDIVFLEEAAMLHDIGIKFTDAKLLGCFGKYPYLAHGYLGRGLLNKEGLPRHALVCERHTGVGISLAEIRINNFPLPKRNLLPVSLEEKIICFADKFYSKIPSEVNKEKTLAEIEKGLAEFGKDKVIRFREWCILFKEPTL
jgi:uncharacterized protein